MPVMPQRPKTRSPRRVSRRNSHGLSTLGARAGEPPISWLMDQALAHPQIISLAAGFTDYPSLPVTETREVLAELLGDERLAKPSLQYGNTVGDISLRRRTMDRLRNLDQAAIHGCKGVAVTGAGYDVDRLLITHGSQQLLYLLLEALCDPGDIVLVEDPTYFVFLGMARNRDLSCRGIRTTPEGVDVAHLASVLDQLRKSGELPRVKLLYLVSYCQNPSGNTTSLANKAAALQLLRRAELSTCHAIYLLEDAAYRELRFAGDDVASALVLPGARRRVIYAGTYSKPFATGIRVGFGLMPSPLAQVVARFKGNHDFGTAHLLQRILTRALESGRFEQHLTALRRRYAAKAAVMGAALKEHCADLLEWTEPHGGLYYWARLRGPGRTGPKSAVFRAALDEQVLYVPGELCYADDSRREKPDCELRLSFGGATEDEMVEGIARLARAVQSRRR